MPESKLEHHPILRDFDAGSADGGAWEGYAEALFVACGGAAPGAGGVDNVCIAWEYGRSMNSRQRKAEMERINSANVADDRDVAISYAA